jgi:hypothetical protein
MIVGQQVLDHAARDPLTTALRVDDERGKLVSAVRVVPDLRDAHDPPLVLRHDEPRPLQPARIYPGRADHRRDVRLVGFAGPPDDQRHFTACKVYVCGNRHGRSIRRHSLPPMCSI